VERHDLNQARPGLELANVTPAVVGLIGTVVGGLIAAGTSSLAEWRREARDQRTAVLLVDSELAAANSFLRALVRGGEEAIFPRETQLATVMWSAHGERLGSTTAECAEVYESIREERELLILRAENSQPLTPDDKNRYGELVDRIATLRGDLGVTERRSPAFAVVAIALAATAGIVSVVAGISLNARNDARDRATAIGEELISDCASCARLNKAERLAPDIWRLTYARSGSKEPLCKIVHLDLYRPPTRSKAAEGVADVPCS
jgi:hypothetical protein